MQKDKNSDLHPCAYFSRTFSSAQRNYDIYDRELLAVILALEEWRQYLQGTAHPITIITDHKNLSYIKDLRKLSRQQARWLLFLQDFDIQWQVTPGTTVRWPRQMRCPGVTMWTPLLITRKRQFALNPSSSKLLILPSLERSEPPPNPIPSYLELWRV